MFSAALRLIVFLVLTVFCLGSNKWDNVYVNDVPGKTNIIVETANTPRYGLKPAEAAAFHANLRRLRDLLMAQPAINSPLGVDIDGWIRADGGGQAVKTAPVRGGGYCNYYPYVLGSKTKQPGRMIASVWTFNVYINDPAGAFEMDGKLFYEPKPAGQINGFPLYRTSQSREIIVLSSTGKPLWFPLTRQEYIQLRIQGIEKELAEAKLELSKNRLKINSNELALLSPKDRAEIEKVLTNDSAVELHKKRLQLHQEALARMSPQDLAAQAQHGNPGDENYLGPDLAPIGKEGIGRPYVKVNPDWLNPSRPRTDIQLIIVGFSYGMDADHPKIGEDGCAADLRLWETLHKSDWNVISGALSK
jgi:hypothetical protein